MVIYLNAQLRTIEIQSITSSDPVVKIYKVVTKKDRINNTKNKDFKFSKLF